MRFTVPTAAVRGPLGYAFSAAGGRTIPVLANVLCTAGDGLTLQGTDSNIAVTARVKADVTSPGICLLSPEVAGFLKECPDLAATFEYVTGERQEALQVTVGDGEYARQCVFPKIDAAFPAVEDGSGEAHLVVTAGQLAAAIGGTLFAATKDEGKFAQRSLCWAVGEKGVRLVATDGKRLVVRDVACERKTDLPLGNHLAQPEAMAIVQKLAAETDPASPFRVRFGGNSEVAWVSVSSDSAAVYSLCVEGRYHDFDGVIPKKASSTATLESAAFEQDVKAAIAIADAEARRVECRFADGRVMLRGEGRPGRSAVPFRLESYKGAPVTINFDPAYLKDLHRIGDTLELRMVDGSKSAVFYGSGVLCLVVPLV